MGYSMAWKYKEPPSGHKCPISLNLNGCGPMKPLRAYRSLQKLCNVYHLEIILYSRSLHTLSDTILEKLTERFHAIKWLLEEFQTRKMPANNHSRFKESCVRVIFRHQYRKHLKNNMSIRRLLKRPIHPTPCTIPRHHVAKSLRKVPHRLRGCCRSSLTTHEWWCL